MIRHLQSLEAALVIGSVAPRLLGSVPVVTLHDSIYSHSPAVDRVADAFREVFQEQKVQFALHVDRPFTKHPCQTADSENTQNVLFQEN